MAAREERLTPATRTYVIFGLVFVIAVGLAVRDWLDPRERRGEADNPLRVLVVSSSEHAPIPELLDVDGFNVAQIDPAEAIAHGRELLDDDAPAYRAAIAYADEHGYGFVALALVSDEIDWELSEAPPTSARYAVFSVGDVAADGPRMHAVGLPEGPALAPRLAELDSLRLGLYDHPDLTRLWTIEASAAEAQARQVLDNRRIDERRELLTRDHAIWAEIDGVWPGHPESAEAAIPYSIAGTWERVSAAPIPGGLLLASRRVRPQVAVHRTVSLELDEGADLWFLPFDAEQFGAREACEGLPARVEGEIAVAPDGSAVVIRQGPKTAELFVFEQGPGCRARRVAALEIGDRRVGRAHASGAMAWNYDDDELRWWDEAGAHQVRVAGVSASSGPWWVDAKLLAMIGERTLTIKPGDEAELDPAALDSEPVLVLLSTVADADGNYPRVELGTRELFGELLPDSPLLDLRPTGPRELVLVSERCPGEPADDPNPCLHRISAGDSSGLAELLPELAAGTRPLAVESLGSIAPYRELAVAPDGSRVAWIDRKQRRLWTADLRGRERMLPRQLVRDDLPEASLRISADGRLVLAEIEIGLESAGAEIELGSAVIARAFPLPPTSADPEPGSVLERDDPVDVPEGPPLRSEVDVGVDE